MPGLGVDALDRCRRLFSSRGAPYPGRGQTAQWHRVSVGVGSPAEAAQWQAIREMIVWLQERHGWSKDDARMLP